ncbi:MAG: transcription termination factor Rho [Chloroflexi bacterium]|nr:transcription termination factor Rho [Chloroflexota bacterium]
MNIAELEVKSKEELAEMARESGISGVQNMSKQDLIFRLLEMPPEAQNDQVREGILEIIGEGYGFLRQPNLQVSSQDIYVSQSQVRRFQLRLADQVRGQVRPPREGERYYGLLRVDSVNGLDPEEAKARPHFENLTPIFPDQLFDLETNPKNLSTRLMNLVAPIGRGQRGLIVSPPKGGKTVALKNIAKAIGSRYDDVHLMVVLIGERPEEVTDWRKTVEAEVIASTFDEAVEAQTRVAELALERAKRLVETGKDVVLLLDSITRLTRAYNLAVPPSGRTLSGGVDPAALYPPKRFFGSARNLEEAGSLTIIAACLIDTGSRMDEVIYEEFKGTGNMELHLDRALAEKRVFPAIDVQRSGTRREELLLDENTLKQVWLVRRMLSLVKSNSISTTEAAEKLLERMARTSNNQEFLATLTKEV